MGGRVAYLIATLATILLGLASRRYPAWVPDSLGEYPGDAFWALMVYLLLGAMRPTASIGARALAALAIAFAVEFGQLYQAPWITAIRATALGHLALGDTFNAPDLAAYAAGAGFGAGAEGLFRRARGARARKYS